LTEKKEEKKYTNEKDFIHSWDIIKLISILENLE